MQSILLGGRVFLQILSHLEILSQPGKIHVFDLAMLFIGCRRSNPSIFYITGNSMLLAKTFYHVLMVARNSLDSESSCEKTETSLWLMVGFVPFWTKTKAGTTEKKILFYFLLIHMKVNELWRYLIYICFFQQCPFAVWHKIGSISLFRHKRMGTWSWYYACEVDSM